MQAEAVGEYLDVRRELGLWSSAQFVGRGALPVACGLSKSDAATERHQMAGVCHYVLIGPCLGAGMGLVQTAVAAAVWSGHGRPDFYFRGWGAVELGLILWGIGGAVLGVPFAAAVAAGEEKFGRRVQAGTAFLSAVVMAAAVAWVLTEMQFARRELLPPLVSEGVMVAVASTSVALWSRPIAAPGTTPGPTV